MQLTAENSELQAEMERNVHAKEESDREAARLLDVLDKVRVFSTSRWLNVGADGSCAGTCQVGPDAAGKGGGMGAEDGGGSREQSLRLSGSFHCSRPTLNQFWMAWTLYHLVLL